MATPHCKAPGDCGIDRRVVLMLLLAAVWARFPSRPFCFIFFFIDPSLSHTYYELLLTKALFRKIGVDSLTCLSSVSAQRWLSSNSHICGAETSTEILNTAQINKMIKYKYHTAEVMCQIV